MFKEVKGSWARAARDAPGVAARLRDGQNGEGMDGWRASSGEVFRRFWLYELRANGRQHF